ncbi:MAG: hypothetical protein EZS28_055415, partial [Streblomastix strix]
KDDNKDKKSTKSDKDNNTQKEREQFLKPYLQKNKAGTQQKGKSGNKDDESEMNINTTTKLQGVNTTRVVDETIPITTQVYSTGLIQAQPQFVVWKVQAGQAHSLALTEDGIVYSWGDNR